MGLQSGWAEQQEPRLALTCSTTIPSLILPTEYALPMAPPEQTTIRSRTTYSRLRCPKATVSLLDARTTSRGMRSLSTITSTTLQQAHLGGGMVPRSLLSQHGNRDASAGVGQDVTRQELMALLIWTVITSYSPVQMGPERGRILRRPAPARWPRYVLTSRQL